MQNVDMKSLQVFLCMLRECNVTRTAQQLHMSQSAVSHTLTRLRALFDDPLFVSMGRGMLPTQRAEALQAPLQHSLDALEALLKPVNDFEPQRFSGTFKIATTDYIGFILLPQLMQRLGEKAPGVELTLQPLRPKDDLEQLKDGKLDLVIWNEKTAPATFHSRNLFSDRLKSVARIGHPQINGSLSLEQFRSAKHLRVSSNHGAVKEAIDGLYEQYAIRCNTALTVPHFLLAHVLVAQTDMIGMIAELTAHRIAKEIPLQLFDPPVTVEDFTVSQVWHQRQHSSPAHSWLRNEIAAVSAEITEELARYRAQKAITDTPALEELTVDPAAFHPGEPGHQFQ